MKTNYLKFGFTLAEVMICLAIISVLATILIPTLNVFKPNKFKTMFKKTYTNAERGIYELIHNEDFYPSDDQYEGFDNKSEVEYLGVKYSGASKFCRLFALMLNNGTEDVDTRCNAGHSFTNGADDYTFVTTDGVYWALPRDMFSDSNTWYEIKVDLNGIYGEGTGPNRLDGNANCKEDFTDRYIIKVRADGKIKLDGACAKKFAGEMNLLKEDE